MNIQRLLGSDIAMVFDDCPPHPSAPRELRAAVERTLRWATECREQPRAAGQMVFGIVQGGSNPALREECAKALTALDFDGYAIGGVSVGEPEPEMMKAVEFTEPWLPAHKARYATAVGLGTLAAQMVELVALGVDMFDCVLPTRVARNGTALHHQGHHQRQSRVQQSRLPAHRGRLRMLCLPQLHSRLPAALVERGGNSWIAHGERAQLAHVPQGDGGHPRRAGRRHVRRIPP